MSLQFAIDRQRMYEIHQRLNDLLVTQWSAGRVDRERAERAVAGELQFHHLGFGTRWIAVGRREIDWSGAHHQHQEWRAQLNRFFQLPSLAEAYTETGDERYAEAARDYLIDWMAAHPAGDDWSPARYDNVLNLAIRVQVWGEVLPRYLASPLFSDAFLTNVFTAITAQLEYLRRHITPYMNWRIAEADALFNTGLRLDFLPHAAEWRATAVRELNDAYHRQILPDGVHAERNPSYHQWMTTVFERYWRLRQAFPDLGLAMEAETVAAMHDYVLASTRPNGSLNALHDCQGERTGSQRTDWGLARERFRRDAGLPDELPPAIHHFPHAGQACLRESWGEDAAYLTFDATIWGGGHCHLSRNAIQLHANGRTLLLDPGSLTYEQSDPMAAHCKSTRAHNTLNLNGWNQSPINPLRTQYYSLPGYELVHSRYVGGYWPGSYGWSFTQGFGHGIMANHHRTLLWLRNRCVVVLDGIEWTPEPELPAPSLECNWQLCDQPSVLHLSDDSAIAHYGDSNLLMCFPLQPPGTRINLHTGEMDPPRGWLGSDHGYVPAPQLCLSAAHLPHAAADLATVLIPFTGTHHPRVQAHAEAPNWPTARTLILTWEDGSRDEIYWTSHLDVLIGCHAEMETDASLVHLHKDPSGKIIQGLVAEGAYCAPYTRDTRKTRETFLLKADG